MYNKIKNINGIIVSYTENGRRELTIPEGTQGKTLSAWLIKNKNELDKEFPIINKETNENNN